MSTTSTTSDGSGSPRRYVLVEQIGTGGFGAVYRAEMVGGSGFRKTVAIKLLNLDISSEDEMAQRLRDEARILGLLNHRCIVAVDDLVQIEGRWGIIMEYVEGVDLRHLLRRGPLPVRVSLEIVREVAMALDVAHSAKHPESGAPLNVVHRDIKPANIRISPGGEVKVLDFGVARAEFDMREAQTQVMRFGSAGYLAPERFDGHDLAPSDIFSLGVVLYECLTAKRMKQLSVRSEQFHQVLDRRLQRLPELPSGLHGLIRRMLAYEMSDRPTAREVAVLLQNITPNASGPWLNQWAPRAVELAKQTIKAAPTPLPAPMHVVTPTPSWDGSGSRASLSQPMGPANDVMTGPTEPTLDQTGSAGPSAPLDEVAPKPVPVPDEAWMFDLMTAERLPEKEETNEITAERPVALHQVEETDEIDSELAPNRTASLAIALSGIIALVVLAVFMGLWVVAFVNPASDVTQLPEPVGPMPEEPADATEPDVTEPDEEPDSQQGSLLRKAAEAKASRGSPKGFKEIDKATVHFSNPGVPAHLEGNGRKLVDGSTAIAGQYEILADFGAGYVPTGWIRVESDKSLTIQCDRGARTCYLKHIEPDEQEEAP